MFSSAVPWNPGVNQARCYHWHSAPGPNCLCGLNAYYTLGEAVKQAHLRPAWSRGRSIIGVVAGKGAVRLHRQGFRCQEAQVLALYTPKGKSRPEQQITKISEKYQVQVYESGKQLQEAVSQLPGVMTMDLSLVEDLPIEDSDYTK